MLVEFYYARFFIVIHQSPIGRHTSLRKGATLWFEIPKSKLKSTDNFRYRNRPYRLCRLGDIGIAQKNK